MNNLKSRQDGLALAIIVPLVALHVWTVVLNFQVNGLRPWGLLMGFFTFGMPILAELLWGWWAFVHSHSYFWGSVAFFVMLLAGGTLLPRADK